VYNIELTWITVVQRGGGGGGGGGKLQKATGLFPKLRGSVISQGTLKVKPYELGKGIALAFFGLRGGKKPSTIIMKDILEGAAEGQSGINRIGSKCTSLRKKVRTIVV